MKRAGSRFSGPTSIENALSRVSIIYGFILYAPWIVNTGDFLIAFFDKCIDAEMDDYLAEHINDIRKTESDKRRDLIQNIPLSKVWGEVDVSGVSSYAKDQSLSSAVCSNDSETRIMA
jgi:hypothetical protein